MLRAGFAGLALAVVATARAEDACARPPALDPAGREGAAQGRVQAVNERLELTLEDGRRLKIAGLDPPRPTPDNPDLDVRSGERLAAWLAGKDIVFRLTGPRPDRWGRYSVEAFAPAQAAAPSAVPVAQAALDAGLARFEPGAAARPCRTFLLAAETTARAGALGLWADPYYAIIAAGDHESFAEKAATSVIVEGRVTGVAKDGFRTTLLFGDRRGFDFSVTILQRNVKIFTAAGVDIEKFQGQTIRVRGLLDMRFGPQIEVSNPDEIEMLPQGQDAAAPKTAPQR
ncbi:Nuclease (SNase domain protein) [Methylocella tundrae]|uniref:Nuclease (SNase domain protein) n=1 Tax=Methylocella tundrae TaxID=227605 RepID=A0A8B6M6J9_METTU|nr:hypothetical protein [Methylocella tundrae]VTZ25228.1 Nuclease (SNase domain protein) [Methylocella tundrae]VTZ50366.1 Nuclease (SNase domain protein) [Methylocella tundrae]